MQKKPAKLKKTEIGMIPEDWELIKLSDITEKITKGTTPTTLKKRFTKSGINFLKVESISDDGTINPSKFMFIDEETDELLKRSRFQENDILYSIAGTIGRVAIVTKNILPANTNQAIAIIRPKKDKIILKYLRYALINPQIKNHLISKLVHAVQANLSLAELGNAPLIYPSLPEQSAIAKILSDLDSKIELLQKQNQTLEKIGQALFKHWFVDFEFPNEEGKPYKSSGGEMVDSELGEIPKGWKVGKIKECGQIICGKTPPTKDKDNFGDAIPFITIPDMHNQIFIIDTERKLSKVGAETQKKKELPSLSICVSCIATPGIVVLTSEKSHTNQQINSIVCHEKISPFFMYLAMKNKSEEIKTKGLGGTATLNLNTGDFGNITLLLPENEIIKQFGNVIEPLFKKILESTIEIKNLSLIRNSLLPKLMSGKIRVPVEVKHE